MVGKSVVVLATEGRVVAVSGIADTVRMTSAAPIASLHALGLLMDDDLRKLPELTCLSRRTGAILTQNLALALGIKAVFSLWRWPDWRRCGWRCWPTWGSACWSSAMVCGCCVCGSLQSPTLVDRRQSDGYPIDAE